MTQPKHLHGEYRKQGPGRSQGSSPGQPHSHGDKMTEHARRANRFFIRLANRAFRMLGKKEVRTAETTDE